MKNNSKVPDVCSLARKIKVLNGHDGRFPGTWKWIIGNMAQESKFKHFL